MEEIPLMPLSLAASLSLCFAECSIAWVRTHLLVRPVKSREGTCLAPADESSSSKRRSRVELSEDEM